jgi:hypothetical protein
MRFVRTPIYLLVALVLAFAAAGCMGDDKTGGTTTNDPDDLVIDTQEEGGPEWAKSIPDAAPGEVLEAFVQASIKKDYKGMWDTLSTATQGRVARSYQEFAKDVGKDFAASVGGFVSGKYRIVNSFRTNDTTAVASIAGERVDPASKQAAFETFGTALMKQKGEWKLEIFGPIVLTLVIPEARIALSRPRVAVSAEAGAPILEVGVWIDGKKYASPTEGASPTQMTIFAEADEEYAPGDHTVMAYASVGDTAVATAWTFIIAD